VVTEGSAGHFFPLDTLWAVANEQEGPVVMVGDNFCLFVNQQDDSSNASITEDTHFHHKVHEDHHHCKYIMHGQVYHPLDNIIGTIVLILCINYPFRKTKKNKKAFTNNNQQGHVS
jgi:hypothetical protein